MTQLQSNEACLEMPWIRLKYVMAEHSGRIDLIPTKIRDVIDTAYTALQFVQEAASAVSLKQDGFLGLGKSKRTPLPSTAPEVITLTKAREAAIEPVGEAAALLTEYAWPSLWQKLKEATRAQSAGHRP